MMELNAAAFHSRVSVLPIRPQTRRRSRLEGRVSNFGEANMTGLHSGRRERFATLCGAGLLLLSLSAVHAATPVPPEFVIRIQGQRPVPPGYAPLPAPGDPVIIRNGADGAVTSGATELTIFELTGPYLVTQIMTYHYGAQKPPGTIALEHEDGTTYEPWPAAGAVGSGNVPNAYWWVQPNVMLKPGRYMVVDSDPSSWSQEAATRGAGIILVWGRPQ
jgi:hypothetical protein